MIEITDVYFGDSKNPNYGFEIDRKKILINKKFVLDMDSIDCEFYSVTGELNGLPVVDLAICKSFLLDGVNSKVEVNWSELLQMTLLNVIEKLAK